MLHPFPTHLPTWSVHDSIQHHDSLRKTPIYIASPFFLWNIGWSQAEIGHIMTNKSTQTTLAAIAIGRVNEYKLAWSPSRNFNTKFNTLEKAKFTFVLECPSEPVYSDDQDKLLATIDKPQSVIAFIIDRQNLIEGATKSVWFEVPIFKERVCEFQLSIWFSKLKSINYCSGNQMWRWWRWL